MSLYSLLLPFNIVIASNCDDVYSPLPQFVIDGINRNKQDYIKIMKITNVPWELLASIHYRETNFSRSNPNNGYGIFQFTPPPKSYPPGPVSDDEFRSQLLYMAERIQNDYVWRNGVNPALNIQLRKLTSNESDNNLIKNTLYSYNGRAKQYADQATSLGFNQPFEGSPYVMNRYDCQRARMGIITKDYGVIDGIDTRYGTFTLYSRIKGIFNSDYYGYSQDPKLFYDQSLNNEVYKNNGNYYLDAGQEAYVKLVSNNYGKQAWIKNKTLVGTLSPRDSDSIIRNSWISSNRAAVYSELDNVNNGDSASFIFKIRAPYSPGLYSERLGIVVEGLSWVDGTEFKIPLAVSARINNTPSKNSLKPGELLTPGQNIISSDKNSVLHLSFSGELELWVNYKRVWSEKISPTSKAIRLINQPDGNVVLYDSNNNYKSLTNSFGSSGNLTIQNDSNLVYYDYRNGAVWSSKTSGKDLTNILNSVVRSGDVIHPGQNLYSQDGYYRLYAQEDGNIVLYTQSNKPIWSSNTHMKRFNRIIAQGDGNIVAYDGLGFPIWSSNTFMSGGNSLIIQQDGNTVFYNPIKPVWFTNTFMMK